MKKSRGGFLSILSKFSKSTIFVALYIIISASFMLQVFKFAQTHIGKKGLIILVGLLLVIPALTFLIYTIIASIKRKRFSLPKTLVIAIILVMLIVLAWQIENFAERIHIAEYAILGWFAARDLIKVNPVRRFGRGFKPLPNHSFRKPSSPPLRTGPSNGVNKKIKSAILACLFCTAVGLTDEIFQWILPYRYFDLNDIVFNTLGGAWGGVLYLITTEGRR